MAHSAWTFDPAVPLRAWIDDPTKSVVDRLSALNEHYSDAYRRCVDEIRRLEEENLSLKQRLDQAQSIVDRSISYLDQRE
jgi:hypothetical protein